MTIRTKLLINVLSLACSFLIIAVVLNFVGNRIVESADKGFFADRIVVGVSDMNTITYDYLMNPSERARQQWELKHASLEALIKGAKFEKEEESVIIQRIKSYHDDTALFFKQLIENNEKKKTANASLRTVLDENSARYVTQLMARSQSMISDAYSLTWASYETIHKVQSWSFWFIVAAIVVITIAASATSLFLSRNIDSSIQTLKKGIEIIAGGDLDHRVPEKGQDEIAMLSKAFNEMTEHLDTSRHELRKLASELVMAEEMERKRIAGVLHDDIAQILASARMRLDMLQDIPSDEEHKVKEAKALLVQSLNETRALMNDLGNPVLSDLGLQAACEALAKQLMGRNPIQIRCDIQDAFKHINMSMKAILHQVVRELLNNVVKHSQAQNAHVMIVADNELYRVQVTDDGVGFDPQTLGAPTVEGGFGLYSLRQRLIAIDGSLNVESAPGAGTVVTAILPAALD